jgi:hypothetical protein
MIVLFFGEIKEAFFDTPLSKNIFINDTPRLELTAYILLAH